MFPKVEYNNREDWNELSYEIEKLSTKLHYSFRLNGISRQPHIRKKKKTCKMDIL